MQLKNSCIYLTILTIYFLDESQEQDCLKKMENNFNQVKDEDKSNYYQLMIGNNYTKKVLYHYENNKRMLNPLISQRSLE